jgi:hypothetical protein
MSTRRVTPGTRIDPANAADVQAWASTLGISCAQLRRIIERAGNDVANIQAQLNWNSQPIRSARGPPPR